MTVRFACGTDPALGPAGISFCSAPVTVTAEGWTTVPGYTVDVAGTRRDTTFGPVLIDRTPPTVSMTMRTATDGLLYVPGTPTVQDVIVSFVCWDNLDPAPTCPRPLLVISSAPVSVTVSDWARNTATYPITGINIDRTGPSLSATITPPPDATGATVPGAVVALTANDPSGVASITYSASGAQPIVPTTVRSVGNPTTFSVPFALTAPGLTTVTFIAADALGNISQSTQVSVTVRRAEPTTLVITSSATLRGESVIVSAQLLGLGAVGVVGRPIVFVAGSTVALGTTDGAGSATA
ncbi:MAG: hypothetical protein NVS1B1_10560 [Candidatus Limnocylindrales bacterium]